MAQEPNFKAEKANGAEMKTLRDKMLALWQQIDKCASEAERETLCAELSCVCARLGQLYREQEIEDDERRKSEEKSWAEIGDSFLKKISAFADSRFCETADYGSDESASDLDWEELTEAVIEKIDNFTDRVCHAIDRAGDWFTDNL